MKTKTLTTKVFVAKLIRVKMKLSSIEKWIQDYGYL